MSIGNHIFLIGVFFLPSALSISVILLLVSIVISISNINFTNKENFSTLIIFCFVLLIISTLNNTWINRPIELPEQYIASTWLNLINWLPIIITSWSFRNYLLESKQRILFSKYFLAGSVTVLISCGLQLWFGFDKGPYAILNGLIIWFQYPIEGVGGLTGLFSNQNITGIWLAITLAFSLGLLRHEKNNFGCFFLIIFNCLIVYFIFLTNSRNAFIGLIVSFAVASGLKKSFIFLISSFVFFYFTNFLYLFINKSNLIENKFIPFGLFEKLNFSYAFLEDRLIIWREAVNLILKRPLSGWGGSTFPYVFPKEKLGLLALHTHNIPLELAYNFGIPISALLIIFILKIGFNSFKKIYTENKNDSINIYNKYWFLGFLIIVITHITDITFLDARINIIFSIIVASLLNIVYKPLKLKDFPNK